MKPLALNNISYTCFESLWETTDLAAYGTTINIVSPCSLTLTLSSLVCQNHSSSLDVHFSSSSKPMTLATKILFPRWKCKLSLISQETLPFKQIFYDLITNLPISNGLNFFLVVEDHGLSKGVILCPTKKTITAEGVETFLKKNKFYTQFSLFNKIISDRRPQFATKFSREFGRILNYNISLSSTYHSQTDRGTEQVNQEIETYLQIFCGENPSDWANNIPMGKFFKTVVLKSQVMASPLRLEWVNLQTFWQSLWILQRTFLQSWGSP